MTFEHVLAYAVPMGVIWAIYLNARRKIEGSSARKLAESAESGLLEPASLHPVIDPAKCLGCGSCVRACPEGQILGLINGKAALVEPSHCIGHGACRTACPTGAITLVFGTERRGVDIPHVNSDFETNVPGLYIAGELGGMGLVRNAVEQGRQAIDSIRKRRVASDPDRLDVLIVGAGPAGFSASLAAMQHKLHFVTVEQDSLGGTVAHFPRGKIVMTAPFTLPIFGRVKFREIGKEHLIEFWENVALETGLTINHGERVETIIRLDDVFEVRTTRRIYRTSAVLLCIGRRGTPRKLEVNGEEQPKVVYRLIDPQQYAGQYALVVGGGDSALEAALSIAEQPGAVVTLSYRGDSFSRAKPKNRQRLKAAQQAGRVTVLLSSAVTRIGADEVEIEYQGRRVSILNDAVIVCVGGILPTPFLESIGIAVETKYGTA